MPWTDPDGLDESDEDRRRFAGAAAQARSWYGPILQSYSFVQTFVNFYGACRMTIFCTPLDLAQSSMAQSHAIGDGTLVLAGAASFGSPTPTNPVRVTATRAVDGARADFFVTGITRNTLTITPADGYADINLSPGDIVGAYMTAGSFSDIHAAILSVETTLALIPTLYAPIDANAAWHPPALADTAALNGSLYYSTTAGQLAYKDAGGTVHPLT